MSPHVPNSDESGYDRDVLVTPSKALGPKCNELAASDRLALALWLIRAHYQGFTNY
jgi:hypothetical protein